MTQSDTCGFCDRPHLFRAQVTWGDMPVYFCSTRCRNSWLVLHNSGTIRLCTLALVFFFCLTFPARAMTIPLNTPVGISGMVCDTMNQVVEILSVHAEQGYEAGVAVLELYEQTPNEEGEPICGTLHGDGVVVVQKMGTFPDLPFPSGTKNVYILRIRYNGAEYYALSLLDVEGSI